MVSDNTFAPMSKLRPRTFRPLDEVESELKVAEDLGYNISMLINDTLRKHLWDDLTQRMIRAGERRKAELATLRTEKPRLR